MQTSLRTGSRRRDYILGTEILAVCSVPGFPEPKVEACPVTSKILKDLNCWLARMEF